MYHEEFLVCIIFAISFGERTKVSQALMRGVRVLLHWGMGEVNVVKEILRSEFAGGAAFCDVGRRAFPHEKVKLYRDFDATKGFPGEDINQRQI